MMVMLRERQSKSLSMKMLVSKNYDTWFARLTKSVSYLISILPSGVKLKKAFFMAGVAQLVRASGCGSEGRGFDPRRLPQSNYQLAVTNYQLARK